MRTYRPEVTSVVATTDEVAAMFTTLAFFLMTVLLWLASSPIASGDASSSADGSVGQLGGGNVGDAH